MLTIVGSNKEKVVSILSPDGKDTLSRADEFAQIYRKGGIEPIHLMTAALENSGALGIRTEQIVESFHYGLSLVYGVTPKQENSDLDLSDLSMDALLASYRMAQVDGDNRLGSFHIFRGSLQFLGEGNLANMFGNRGMSMAEVLRDSELVGRELRSQMAG